MDSAEEASRALQELNGQQVMGRPVKININTPRRDRFVGARPSTLSFDHAWRPQPAHQQQVGKGEGTSYVYDRWQRKDAADHFKAPSEEGRRLYVGGLPRIPNQDTVNEEMRALFKDYKM